MRGRRVTVKDIYICTSLCLYILYKYIYIYIFKINKNNIQQKNIKRKKKTINDLLLGSKAPWPITRNLFSSFPDKFNLARLKAKLCRRNFSELTAVTQLDWKLK